MKIHLRHEALTFGDSDIVSFGPASLDGRSALEAIEGPSVVAYVEYAASHEEAMQRHYDRQGWGSYALPQGMITPPYGREELDRQLVDYPDDGELRRLNGL